MAVVIIVLFLMTKFLPAEYIGKLIFVKYWAQKCKCSTLEPVTGLNEFCKTVYWQKSIENFFFFLSFLIFNPFLPSLPCLYAWKYKMETLGKIGMNIL